MRMWAHREPGACIVVTMRSLVRKDFIDGACRMLGKHWWGQVPELAWVDVTVWGGLWWPVEDWLELFSDGHGKVIRCHPLLSSW